MVAISVIIPTFNSADTIAETVQSVADQSFQPIEILVVDDCSTDGTLVELERLGKSIEKLRVLKTKQNFGGPAGPRNVGLKNAIGDFVANNLRNYGVGLTYVGRTNGRQRTSLAFAEVNAEKPEVVIYRNNASDLILNEAHLEKLPFATTKAIIITHIYGLPVDLEKILRIAKKRNIVVIEDAAEVIGLKYKNKICGSFGDLSTFSFYANKHITTGEGGMICTNNKKYYEKCKSLRNLSFSKSF